MKVQRFQLGAFLTNSYLAVADDSRAAVLIDAPEEIEQVLDACDRLGLVPGWLINTHGHVDHIQGNAAVKRRWPDIRLAIHTADAAKLTSPLRNLSLLTGTSVTSPPADVLLNEGDRIPVGNEELEVLYTPGHTAGGLSLVLRRPAAGPPVVFTGDTLFCEGIGRTDFPGASQRQLLDGIRAKLLTLPDETVCYPGHGPATTIGRERAGNPYLEGNSP